MVREAPSYPVGASQNTKFCCHGGIVFQFTYFHLVAWPDASSYLLLVAQLFEY